ncbi:DUF58 domain-containing protein [Candidatus Woesearchaeota archaeon]|nr:DUF58 domain-containing protein [Candidatus Woesearchaeota archaeon]
MKELNVNFTPLIKKLEMSSRRGMFGHLTGEYRSAFKGRGLEFTGYRKYDPSDDASLIDWKASLRSKDLVVREMVDERNLEILFAFDVSSSMSFASGEKLKNEYAAELIATLAFAMVEGGDSVGLYMFTDRMVQFLPPNMGNRQYYFITRLLSDPMNYDGNFDFVKALTFMSKSVKANTIIIIVSDFIGLMDQKWEEIFKRMAARSEIIGIMIRDPSDDHLLTLGPVAVSDPFSPHEMLLDTTETADEFAKVAGQQKQHIKEVFRQTGSDIIELRTDQPFLNKVTSFLRQRTK